MTIVCGTDFSDRAAQAAWAEGATARRFGVPLLLVHVVDEDRSEARHRRLQPEVWRSGAEKITLSDVLDTIIRGVERPTPMGRRRSRCTELGRWKGAPTKSTRKRG